MAEPYLGEIKIFAGDFAPKGYALCNGQLMPINQNQALFALLGTTYGGDGRTTFALPDLRGRVQMHQGQGTGLSPAVMGESIGAEAITINAGQLPLHGHSQMASTNSATAAFGPSGAPGTSATTSFYGGTPQTPMDPAAVGITGGGQPHDNMAPYLALTFIIALVGIFPSRN